MIGKVAGAIPPRATSLAVPNENAVRANGKVKRKLRALPRALSAVS